MRCKFHTAGGVPVDQTLHCFQRIAMEALGRMAGRWLLAYLSQPATISLRLDAIPTRGRVQAAWIDPTNGNRIPAGIFTAHGSHPFTTPPGWEDALFLVKAE